MKIIPLKAAQSPEFPRKISVVEPEKFDAAMAAASLPELRRRLAYAEVALHRIAHMGVELPEETVDWRELLELSRFYAHDALVNIYGLAAPGGKC